MVTTSGSLSREVLSASSSAASIDSARSESSWTPYIVDFLIHGDRENSSYDADQHRGSSMVSDAATESSGGNSVRGRAGDPGRALRLRKRKNKGKSPVDEALEDTASSPNNSPKVNIYTYIFITCTHPSPCSSTRNLFLTQTHAHTYIYTYKCVLGSGLRLQTAGHISEEERMRAVSDERK